MPDFCWRSSFLNFHRNFQCQLTAQQSVANRINAAESLFVKSTVKDASAPLINCITTFPITLGSPAKKKIKVVIIITPYANKKLNHNFKIAYQRHYSSRTEIEKDKGLFQNHGFVFGFGFWLRPLV